MIEIGKKELLENGKMYIVLPTGSGKSFIVYNLFNSLKCNFIIIMSPRIIVNEQNILQKYLQILEENMIFLNIQEILIIITIIILLNQKENFNMLYTIISQIYIIL